MFCFPFSSLYFAENDSGENSTGNSSSNNSTIIPGLADWVSIIIILGCVLLLIVIILCFGILCTRRNSNDDLFKEVGRDNWDMRNGYMYPDSPEPMFTIATARSATGNNNLNRSSSINMSRSISFNKSISPNRSGTPMNRPSAGFASSPESRMNSTALHNSIRNVNTNNDLELELDHFRQSMNVERLNRQPSVSSRDSDVTLPHTA